MDNIPEPWASAMTAQNFVDGRGSGHGWPLAWAIDERGSPVDSIHQHTEEEHPP